jgi:hypothetical protein
MPVRVVAMMSILAALLLPAAPAFAAATPATATPATATAAKAAGAQPSGTAATRPNQRAMWLWNRPPAAEVVDWAVAHGVRELIAYVPTRPDLPWLRDLHTRATAAGLTLAALNGDPAWTTNHQAALDWQRAAAGTGLFAALHVDIEPYALPAWRTDQTRTAQSYLAVLEKLNAASTLPLDADVAFWYGQVALPKKLNLATEVLARVDAVTVMSYRDTATGPNSILDVGADLLARGVVAGRPVRLAAETEPLPDCGYCTFATRGATALDAAVAKVDAAAAGYGSYAGLAVHHYTSWRALAA